VHKGGNKKKKTAFKGRVGETHEWVIKGEIKRKNWGGGGGTGVGSMRKRKSKGGLQLRRDEKKKGRVFKMEGGTKKQFNGEKIAETLEIEGKRVGGKILKTGLKNQKGREVPQLEKKN